MRVTSNHTLRDRLRRMVETIVTEVDPDQIILFGSQARGDASEISDVDLLIIVGERIQNSQERVEIMTRLWRALSSIPGPKDLLVYSREEVERWKEATNHVVARSLREGEVLYER